MGDLQIAKTILEQLGGHRFIAMTGAKQFIAHPAGLSFRLPGRPGFVSDGINYVKITVNAHDTYDVVFLRTRGVSFKTIAEKKGLYCDQLREVFTRTTGLSLTLGIPAAEMLKFHNRHED